LFVYVIAVVPAATPVIEMLAEAALVNETIALLAVYHGVVGVAPLFKAALVALPVSVVELPWQMVVLPEKVGAGFTVTVKAVDVQPLVLV
jgi:hypothetical protein